MTRAQIAERIRSADFGDKLDSLANAMRAGRPTIGEAAATLGIPASALVATMIEMAIEANPGAEIEIAPGTSITIRFPPPSQTEVN